MIGDSTLAVNWREWTSDTTPKLSLRGQCCWARLLDVHDGDTITVAAQVFDARVAQFPVRVDGIDAPEMTSRDPDLHRRAERARVRLAQLLAPDVASRLNPDVHTTRGEMRRLLQQQQEPILVYIQCGSNDKYGRVLARVSTTPDGEHVGCALISEGLANKYDGGTKASFAQ